MHSVYCIIVSYNGMAWIGHCLDSLLDSQYPVKIIVVDNKSTDDTASFVKYNYATVTCLESEKNLGFGQGNNMGIQYAMQRKADYIFLLNQDAWVERGTIGTLVQAHLDNPGYGIISPIHLNGAGSYFEQDFGQYLAKSATQPLLWNALRDKPADKPLIQTDFVNAAAWLISAACIKKTGGFDPIFFHYGEDDHYAQRANYHGFRIGIFPGAFIYHDNLKSVHDNANSLNKGINREWVFFLTHACNINRPGFYLIMFKRGTRHFFQFLTSLPGADEYKKSLNARMSKNIFSFIARVKKSRYKCKYGKTPYLKMTA